MASKTMIRPIELHSTNYKTFWMHVTWVNENWQALHENNNENATFALKLSVRQVKLINFYVIFPLQGKGALVTYWLHGKISAGHSSRALKKTRSGSASSSGVVVELDRATWWWQQCRLMKIKQIVFMADFLTMRYFMLVLAANTGKI